MKTRLCSALLTSVLAACSGYVGDGASSHTGSSGSDGSSAQPDGEFPAITPNANGGTPSGTDYQGLPLYTRLNRLSNEQWANSVKDLLKLGSAPDVSELPQPVTALTDFTNNENVLNYDDANWLPSVYKLAESTIKTNATDALLAKVYTGTDAAGFIKAVGRRALRRPLTTTEVSRYQTVFDAGSQLSGTGTAFTKGAGLVLEMLIQSPHFVNRVEAGVANKPLDGYEVAAKLSLWLLNTAPSDALLERAPTLTSADAIAAEAKTMLEQPAAVNVMRHFYSEWLEFSRLGDIQKDDSLKMPVDIGDELLEVSTKYFDRVFAQDLGLGEILTGTRGYIGPKTAALYGVKTDTVKLADFGAARTGYFAQVPYQLLFGTYGGQSDPIHRGANFQRKVLCGILPPPQIVPPPVNQAPLQTKREVVASLTEVDGCSACHGQYINPLGYVFENFDGLGRIRTEDNGAAVDTSAAYPFPGVTAKVSNHAQLMQAAVNNEMAHICYVKHIASYGLGRDIVRADEPWLRKVAEVSQANGSMKEVILALVKQPAFSNRAGGTQ